MDGVQSFVEAYQGVFQLTRRGTATTYDGYLAEARVMEWLRDAQVEVMVAGARKKIRAIMRNLEASHCDLYILAIDDEVRGVPGPKASDHEMWQWARQQGEGQGIKWIPADVKIIALNGGNATGYRDILKYSRGGGTKKHQYEGEEAPKYEVIFAWIMGTTDAIAVLPTLSWAVSKDWGYDIEPLTSKVPLFSSLFMIRRENIGVCLQRIVKASLSPGSWFVNPDTKVTLTGWRPRSTDRPVLFLEHGTVVLKNSSVAMIELSDEIASSGDDWRVDMNRVQPCLYDFELYGPGGLLLGCEFKLGWTFLKEDASDGRNLGRRYMFASNRQWDVLFARVDTDKLFCALRDETVTFDTREPPGDFLRKHTFGSFAAARAHIMEHAAAAKSSRIEALRQMRPEDVCQGMREEEMLDDDTGDSRFAGRTWTYRETLADVHRQLNAQAAEGAWGLFLPVGEGHVVGHVAILDHEWTTQQQELYRVHGELPLTLWSPGVSGMSAGVLRLQNHVAPSNRKPLDMPLAIHRHEYKKPAEDGRHFLLLGDTMSPQLQSTDEERNAQFTLIPSGFTVLSGDEDVLPRPSLKDMEFGAHIARPDENSQTELTIPPWNGLANTTSMANTKMKFIKDSSVNPVHYMLNLADGSVYNAIREVMTSDKDRVRIDNPRWPGKNTLFDPRPYRMPLHKLQQFSWDYGYERNCRSIDVQAVVDAFVEGAVEGAREG